MIKRAHAVKPVGWSYSVGRAPAKGFKFGVWGGSLTIPSNDFKEWFVRVPGLGLVVTLTRFLGNPDD